MKIIITLLLTLLWATGVWAEYNVILYSIARTPVENVDGSKEHWKDEIPDLGEDEVLRDFYVLYRSGNRMLSHALLFHQEQIDRVRNHLQMENGCPEGVLMGSECTTPIPLQIYSWWHRDTEGVYQAFYLDSPNHPTFKELAKQALRYPVETTCDGEPCTLIVSIKMAETVYGETIDPQKIMIPHTFSGR